MKLIQKLKKVKEVTKKVGIAALETAASILMAGKGGSD